MDRRRSLCREVVLAFAGVICTLVPRPASAAVTGHAMVSSPFDSLRSQIAELRSADRYEDAVPLARGLLDAQTNEPGTKPWQVADTRSLIRTLEAISAMPPQARRALAEADRLGAAIDTHYEYGDFETASNEAARQVELRRKYLGDHDPDLVESMVSLAFTEWKLGNHSAAICTATEAMKLAERIDAKHPRMGECLNVLGLAYMASGDFDNAEAQYRRALEIFREQTGEESLEFTMALENLGALCGERAEWALAEPYYQRCLRINRALLGPRHPEVARSLHNLGCCYVGQHDVLRAKPLLEEALEVRKVVLGADHPDVALTAHILSDVYRVEGDLDYGHRLLEGALAIRQKRLPPNHPQIAWNLYALSSVELTTGDYAAALARGEQALAIWVDSDEKMQYSRGLWLMGTLAWVRGDLAAVDSYDREIQRILQDCDCGEYSRVLQRSAAVSAYYGRHAEAESLLVVAAGVFETLRRTSAAVEHRGWVRVANPYRLLAAERLRVDRPEDAWPALERWLARGLIDQLAVTDGAKDGWVYGLDEIRASLGGDEAIIGWLDIEGIPGPAAWGYVIRSEGPVKWVALSAEETRPIRPGGNGSRYHNNAISEHAAYLRDGLRYAAAWPARVSQAGRLQSRESSLWQERMGPLEPYLHGVDHLVVIPSRVMMGVPVETMIDASGVYLLDRYSVSYAPSGTVYRWLVDRRRARGANGIDKALLVGDPAFAPATTAETHGADSHGDIHLAAAAGRAATSTFETTVLRSALAGNPDALRALPALERSQREVDAIARLVADATVLVGTAASEKKLRDLVQSGQLADFDLLHFATHAIVDQYVPETSALVLSQLDRSEFELPLESTDDVIDGLLDVREIIGQWRLTAELVTLSACRTALGPASQGEGYLGFAQAFLRAGAQSVIVSLWDVDDTATSMLMARFYENLTGHGTGLVTTPMPKAEALREAKQWLRDYTNANGTHPFAHPTYWSAFILIGDPL